MATRAGELAMDPPQEDMNYKEFVSVATTSIPKELEDTPTFSALTSILNSLGYVLAHLLH